MTAQVPATRRYLLLALKVLAMAAAVWLVSRQVTWYDRVSLVDGREISGRIEKASLETEALEVALVDLDRRREVFPAAAVAAKKVGVVTAFSDLSLGHYLLGMGLILVMYLIGVYRWSLLLAAQGLPSGYWRAFRLTFVGFFWNNFMPGMTGGDVAKAVIVAKDSPGRRSEAVSTVIVDRVIGLAVLALLSAFAILANFSRFEKQGYVVFAVLAGCLALFVCFFSKRIRRRLRLSRFLNLLPASGVLKKLDNAFHSYRDHPRAVILSILLSVVSHVCNIGSVWVFGMDLGIQAELITYFATVPIIFIVASVPLFPGGWGVREVAFTTVFTGVGVSAQYTSNLVILSVLIGFSTMIWSLLGGLFLFLGRREGEIPAALDEQELEVALADAGEPARPDGD
ncbi:MAG: flippase-like domain-containing protein [Planctomycetes bacterium]|nr:flippase-like domain-containing protein [Planctomycetota bacterium]